MRRLLALVAILAITLPLAGCQSTCPEGDVVARAPVTAVAVPAAAAPCPAAAPAPVAAPAVAYTAAAPVAIEYRVGAEERARAALAVPPQVMQCLVNGGYEILTAAVKAVNCAAQNLIPQPQPTARYLYAPTPPPMAAPPPTAAPPCR